MTAPTRPATTINHLPRHTAAPTSIPRSMPRAS
jgi:hypothetical protein